MWLYFFSVLRACFYFKLVLCLRISSVFTCVSCVFVCICVLCSSVVAVCFLTCGLGPGMTSFHSCDQWQWALLVLWASGSVGKIYSFLLPDWQNLPKIQSASVSQTVWNEIHAAHMSRSIHIPTEIEHAFFLCTVFFNSSYLMRSCSDLGEAVLLWLCRSIIMATWSFPEETIIFSHSQFPMAV